MAQIVIRNLDDEIVERLKKRAKLQGRSLEAEVRLLLTNSVQFDPGRVREIRARYGERQFGDSSELIREDRDR